MPITTEKNQDIRLKNGYLNGVYFLSELSLIQKFKLLIK